jgi:hypothetical protein
MTRTTPPNRILFLLTAAAVIASATGASAIGAPEKTLLTITSTLDGKTALPHHINWYAYAPGTKIKRVEFLIDGKVRWIERKAPYIYGDHAEDFGKTDRGYLVTSWLSPGLHRFGVRVTAKDGRRATKTVTARTASSPDPPAALAGRWRRIVDPAGAPKPGTAGAPKDTPTPEGTYTLVFDKRWIQTRNPGAFSRASVDKNTGLGYIQDTDYVPGSTTFRVWGAVSWRPFEDYLAEEGTWCLPWGGPRADYSWAVNGDKLILVPLGGNEPCRVRQFIWSGEWTRVT